MEQAAADGKPSLSDGRKEQIKLTSAYFNGIAIGLLLVAGLSIPTTLITNAETSVERWAAGAISLFSISFSPYLHLRAKRTLKGLDP